ncbi:cellulase family glycosylhydrolase [Niveibacterium sp. COAC-50]|uniref:cellulase family glycosylhydrolase n=1 Tax=Niveibacterium sp. COAC-50 TaxID=2729384 RepID=UPI001552D955|nr:cellulase family glycosylhydrolase [Niveibacterium sp. COAC-50]
MLFLWHCGIALAKDDFVVGVNVATGQNKVRFEEARALLSMASFTSVRVEFYWHRLQLPGKSLSFPDSLNDSKWTVEWMRKAGGRPLVVLDYGNDNFGGGLPLTPAARAGFSEYAKFLVRILGDAVSYYEIWNEWNIGAGALKGSPRYGDPAAYVELAKTASESLRNAGSKAKVLCGGIADLNQSWAEETVALGIMKYCDGYSVHPYVFGFGRTGTAERSIAWVKALQRRLSAIAGFEVPIYITEIGWPTSTNQEGVSEGRAADELKNLISLARNDPHIKGVWIYELVDSGSSDNEREHRFGLVRRDLTPKRAFMTTGRGE